MNVTSVYFSATYTTKKGVEAIAKGLDHNQRSIDITMCNSINENISLENQDVVIFGVPVYGGRVFEGAIDRIKYFKGNNTPCVLVATYGNRGVDDALIELFDTVKENGFIVIAAASLIGEHTYGTIQSGRPNKNDLLEDSIFARKIHSKLKKGDIKEIVIFGNRPYRKGATKGGKFTPLTNNSCIQCGLCAENCPSKAIDNNNFSLIDFDKCISCFRCIKNCPVGAKNSDFEDYNNFAISFTEKTNKVSLKNEYFGV